MTVKQVGQSVSSYAKICYCNINENAFSREQKLSEVMFENMPVYLGTMQ